MERYTKHLETGGISGSDKSQTDTMLKRLVAYEDTELTPEEIEQIKISDASKESCTIEQHNRIKEIESDRDYWEREAKKWCDKSPNTNLTDMKDLLERAVEELENCYGRETELTIEIRKILNILT